MDIFVLVDALHAMGADDLKRLTSRSKIEGRPAFAIQRGANKAPHRVHPLPPSTCSSNLESCFTWMYLTAGRPHHLVYLDLDAGRQHMGCHPCSSSGSFWSIFNSKISLRMLDSMLLLMTPASSFLHLSVITAPVRHCFGGIFLYPIAECFHAQQRLLHTHYSGRIRSAKASRCPEAVQRQSAYCTFQCLICVNSSLLSNSLNSKSLSNTCG